MPIYEKRRQIITAIPKFWPVALLNNSMIAFHVQHSADQLALSYLEDVWVVRDATEPRCYTIEFVCQFSLPDWTLVYQTIGLDLQRKPALY